MVRDGCHEGREGEGEGEGGGVPVTGHVSTDAHAFKHMCLNALRYSLCIIEQVDDDDDDDEDDVLAGGERHDDSSTSHAEQEVQTEDPGPEN